MTSRGRIRGMTQRQLQIEIFLYERILDLEKEVEGRTVDERAQVLSALGIGRVYEDYVKIIGLRSDSSGNHIQTAYEALIRKLMKTLEG